MAGPPYFEGGGCAVGGLDRIGAGVAPDGAGRSIRATRIGRAAQMANTMKASSNIAQKRHASMLSRTSSLIRSGQVMA